jgi:16S rRNA (guanine966-N2)-methyltransferase
MRIIAGKARGTRLESPAGAAIRPTGDRVREALFNILEHAIAGFHLTGARVLDLFAGSGALGLEALSRGAGFCVFIDIDAAARGLVRLNVERTHMTGHSRISRRDAADLGPIGRYQPFDLVLADPPYGKHLGAAAARSLVDGGWLNPGAVVVVEEVAGADFAWPDGLAAIEERRYGDTVVRIARAG